MSEKCSLHVCSIISTLSDSATPCSVVHQAPLSMGFPRQEYWSGGAISSSRRSSQPRDPTCISYTCRQIFFYWWAIWEAPKSGDSLERLHIKEWESLRVGLWDIHFQQVLKNELLMLPLEFMKYRLLRHSAPHVSLVLTWLCLFSKVRV